MISSFSGYYRFLSNFEVINVELKGKIWKTSEHIFQACKTLDPLDHEKIRLAYTPGKAKRLGKNVKIRRGWNKIRVSYMLKCLRIKFKYIKLFRELLLSTGQEKLVEGNYWHDNFWGDCSCKKCKAIKGQNNLGVLLMALRKELKNS